DGIRAFPVTGVQTCALPIYDIDFRQGLGDHPVHHAVHRPAVPGLEAGGVDEDELVLVARQHAVDAVAGRLRLARNDGQLRPDQGVAQGGFAHVGAAHDGDETATAGAGGIHFLSWEVGSWGFSWATATGRDSWAGLRRRADRRAGPSDSMAVIAWPAAACSAARRLLPEACTRMPSAGTSHTTSNIWSCAAPRVATTS